jgi:hypothetical protein
VSEVNLLEDWRHTRACCLSVNVIKSTLDLNARSLPVQASINIDLSIFNFSYNVSEWKISLNFDRVRCPWQCPSINFYFLLVILSDFYDAFTGHQSKNVHLAVQRVTDLPDYSLPLPANIDSAETTRFNPLRNQDLVSVSAVAVHTNNIDITLNAASQKESITFNDPHLDSYVPSTGVNLAGVMQTTVPEPLGGNHKFSHMNMPGGGA